MIKGINLVPEDVQREWRIQRWRIGLYAGGAVYALILAIVFAGEFYTLGKKKTELKAIEAERDALISKSVQYAELSKKFEMMKKSESELQKRLSAASDLSGKKVSWSAILKKLSHDTPSGVWLRGMSTSDEKDTGEKKIRFLGSATSNKAVADFAFILENSGYCKDVTLSYTQKREAGNDTVYDFEIFATLKKSEEIMHEW